VTLDTRAVLDVLHHAKRTGLPLPEAVESFRAELRAFMRQNRKRVRDLRSRGRGNLAAGFERMIHRQRIMSARVRRLQRTYASWQAPPVEPKTEPRASRAAREELSL
jgi:hypothetical protein